MLALFDHADVGVASLCMIVTCKYLYWANSEKEHCTYLYISPPPLRFSCNDCLIPSSVLRALTLISVNMSLADLAAKQTVVTNQQNSVKFQPSGLLLYTGYNRCNSESEFLRKLQALLRQIEEEERKKLITADSEQQ